jgi:para-nitrobenzyl esterase
MESNNGMQAEMRITRRSLLGGAAALSSAAVLTGAAAPLAPKAWAVATKSSEQKYHPIVASSTKNVVETDSGKIYGYGRDGVIGYRGIPYGASTEGKNRFMPPAKPEPWTGVRSALYWGWASPCSMNATWDGRRPNWARDDESFMFEWDDGQASEDCLRLNVWTPGLDNNKRAVMFWIHGGGMVFGSDNELRAYDGENLARRQDVVVVSLNHRLGVLGFLNLMEYGDQYATSPNVSMLDIVQALKWVQTNIANFGGDPNRVMIFGQSGGGSKVGTLMGMPAAKGLFHRASIQSGSSLRQSTIETSANLAHATLAELGVTKDDIGKLHTDFTYQQIVQAALVGQKKASHGATPLPGMPGVNWGPVVDGKLIPRDTWVPAAPDESASVPLIVGTVLNEANNSVQMGDASLEDVDEAGAKKLLDRSMGSHTDQVYAVAKKLYPDAKPFELFSRAAAMRQRMNALAQAELKTKQGTPAYHYRFEYQSPLCDGRARAFHTSELPFCFQNAELCAKLTGNTPQTHVLAEQVAGAWAAFAKTGNPNHSALPKWDAYSDKIPTMTFNTECALKDDPDRELRQAVKEATA